MREAETRSGEGPSSIHRTGVFAEEGLVDLDNSNSNVRIIYKWKNHFYEMKGDVGMSVHEKKRKQEDAYTKIQTHS